MTEIDMLRGQLAQARADLQTLINAVKSHRDQISAEDLRFGAKSAEHVDNVVAEIERRLGE